MVRAFLDNIELTGLAEENLQARARGVTLMGLSNQYGHLVLATGNKSELAVGYSTIYGDAVGGYAPLKDVPKTLVWELARWRNAAAQEKGETRRSRGGRSTSRRARNCDLASSTPTRCPTTPSSTTSSTTTSNKTAARPTWLPPGSTPNWSAE